MARRMAVEVSTGGTRLKHTPVPERHSVQQTRRCAGAVKA